MAINDVALSASMRTNLLQLQGVNDKIGQKQADTSELFFEDVRVPITNCLGEEGRGFAYLMTQLPQERPARWPEPELAAHRKLRLRRRAWPRSGG